MLRAVQLVNGIVNTWDVLDHLPVFDGGSHRERWHADRRVPDSRRCTLRVELLVGSLDGLGVYELGGGDDKGCPICFVWRADVYKQSMSSDLMQL